MEKSTHIFHLAIPCRDLDEAIDFYQEKLGCRMARRHEDRVNFDFFGDQLVCHLAPNEIDEDPKMYPRHFGVTFLGKESFDKLLDTVNENNLEFFAKPFERFKGKPESHHTFFLKDPSNNLIEFKCYKDPKLAY